MFISFDDYEPLKNKLIDDIKKNIININDKLLVKRDTSKKIDNKYAIISYEKAISDEETITAKELLKELCYYSNIFNCCSTQEYAIINSMTQVNVKNRCQRGAYKTAEKVGGVWLLDPYEEHIDNRYK